MIVYSATRAQFTADVHRNEIEAKILEALRSRTERSTQRNEIDAWRNSMQYMNNVLVDGAVPEDAGVAIEYGIPLTSKRVDFILTGRDGADREVAVIVELKQWSEVEATEKDAVVLTVVGGGKREMLHPSYQAWTYAALIKDFNETAQDDSVDLVPCAYLHNCESGDVINASFYSAHTQRAPAFVRSDVQRLQEFIGRYIRRGDRGKLLYRIDSGRLKPSKKLVDHLVSLLHGNREFQLIDEQKLVYETALALADAARDGRKQVLIVEAGRARASPSWPSICWWRSLGANGWCST